MMQGEEKLFLGFDFSTQQVSFYIRNQYHYWWLGNILSDCEAKFNARLRPS